MVMTKHSTHDMPRKGCMVCRWDQMDEAQRSAHREDARAKAEAAWRGRFPEKAARRDEILARKHREPCACGSQVSTPFVTDYEAGLVTWRCRPCAKKARLEYRRSGTADLAA
jgi:hypothetical protein